MSNAHVIQLKLLLLTLDVPVSISGATICVDSRVGDNVVDNRRLLSNPTLNLVHAFYQLNLETTKF